MNKRRLKLIVLILLILLILWIFTICVDIYRCFNLKKPIFAFSTITDGLIDPFNETVISYNCLGYRVESFERDEGISLIRFYMFNKYKCIEVRNSNL